MDGKTDAVTGSVAKVATVTGCGNDLPRRGIDGRAGHSRPYRLDGLLLCPQHETVNLSLSRRRPSDTERSGDIAEISVSLGAEIDRHQVSVAQTTVRDRGVGH